MKTIVMHWHYNDGYRAIPEVLWKHYGENSVEYDEHIKGWHCWVYAENGKYFQEWLSENMVGPHECNYRFNGGNPIYTVTIKEDNDATLFKLRWM